MNQANIDSLTARVKVGSLVQILFQADPIFGLVVAISKSKPVDVEGRKKRSMTFLTLTTKQGLRKYPIFWCKIIEQ
jgi:hypothetical protein